MKRICAECGRAYQAGEGEQIPTCTPCLVALCGVLDMERPIDAQNALTGPLDGRTVEPG